MLPLHSPRWESLKHAYGSAGKETSSPSAWSAESGFSGFSQVHSVVECLRALESDALPNGNSKSWESLFSSLYHQDKIYSASFAAVPHILDIGLRMAEHQEIDIGFFLLPTLIEQARLDGQEPDTPADILFFYLSSLPRIHDLAYVLRRFKWDHSYAAIISSALAAAQGHLQLSRCALECADRDTAKEFLDRLSNDHEPDEFLFSE